MESPAESIPIRSIVRPTAEQSAAATAEPGVRRSHWRWAAPLLLLALVLVAFVPALAGGLVDWDDDDLLLNETTYRTLTWESLRWMFTTTFAGHYQPLTWLSYTLDWWLWGRETFGYHLTSVLLHAGSAIVFFFIVRRLIERVVLPEDEPSSASLQSFRTSRRILLCSATAAAIFAVHPLRVESVAWLAERRDVLSGFFYLLCILFYIRYVSLAASPSRAWQSTRTGSKVDYAASLVFCGLSLLSKASGMTLPIVLLILDAYPLRRSAGNAKAGTGGFILDKLPFLALCVPAGVLAYVAQRAQGAMYPLSEYGLDYRAAQALYGLTFYVVKTVWPSNLGPLYEIPTGNELLGPLLWQGLGGTAALAASAWFFRRSVPAITAAIAVYAVQVFPVLGFAQSGPQLVADRYSYLPTLGFAALGGAGLYRLTQAMVARGDKDVLRLVGLGAVAVVIALAHGTFRQADVWRSPLTLWSRGVQVSPDSSIARTSYGDALVFQAPAAALHEYKTALSLNPRDVIAVRHMAKLLLIYGDSLRAAAFYQYAVALDPTFGPLYPDYATALEHAGRPDTAVEVLRERIAAVPDDFACTAYLAHLLSTHPDDDVRNGAEAVELATRVDRRPGGPDAKSLLLLATALAEEERFDEAVNVAEEALRMAQAAGEESRLPQIEQRLELFRRNEPYRIGR